MKLFDSTTATLEHALDVRLARQNVLGSNLANVDTPNYQPREIDFDRAMAAADQASASGLTAASATPGHLPLNTESSEGAAAATKNLETGLDGNAVDLDKTMIELSRNGLMYGAAARTVGKKLAILRYVASDGVG